MDLASLAGSAALIAASFLALGWIRQAEQCRNHILAFASLYMAHLSLWVGVDVKWHIFVENLPKALVMVYAEHPGLRIGDDAIDILTAMAMYIAIASTRKYRVIERVVDPFVEPYTFVKPADRPRPRVSPFEQQS